LRSFSKLIFTLKSIFFIIRINPGVKNELFDLNFVICSYTAALSAGLALLNLLPCYGFDGQHIFNLLAEVALGVCGVRSPTVTSTVAAGFTAVGTGCLLAWLFTAVRKLILL